MELSTSTSHPKSVKLSQKQSENGSKLFDTEYQINGIF